jgi:hypothetical protein
VLKKMASSPAASSPQKIFPHTDSEEEDIYRTLLRRNSSNRESLCGKLNPNTLKMEDAYLIYWSQRI